MWWKSKCDNSRVITKNGHCNTDCGDSEYKYNNKCFSECPNGTLLNGNECQLCESFGKYENEYGVCVDNCKESNPNSSYIYSNNENHKCSINCSSNFKIQDYSCVEQCNSSRYQYDNYCLEECPPDKRFFNESNFCLDNCNKVGYEFYTTKYKCLDSCNHYVRNINKEYNLKLCFDEDDRKCNKDYPFYEIKGEETICDSVCPPEKPFYKKSENEEEMNCLEICQDNTIYLLGSYECIDKSKCPTKKINYDTKECVENCPYNISEFYSEIDDITYCVEKCDVLPKEITNLEFTLLSTTDRRCVTECPEYTEKKGGKCECIKFYYYEKETHYKKCLNPNMGSCKQNAEYSISVINEKDPNECIDICYGTLSSSGFECYPSDYTCDKEYEKLITFINGRLKCECIDKYYYNYDEYGIKIKNCLKSGNNCPENFKFLIAETR